MNLMEATIKALQEKGYSSDTINYNFANRLIVYFNDGRITNIEILFDGPSGGVTC